MKRILLLLFIVLVHTGCSNSKKTGNDTIIDESMIVTTQDTSACNNEVTSGQTSAHNNEATTEQTATDNDELITEKDIKRTHYIEKDTYIVLQSCIVASNDPLNVSLSSYNCVYKDETVLDNITYYMYEGKNVVVLVEKTGINAGEIGSGNIIVQQDGIELLRTTFIEPYSDNVLSLQPLYVDITGGGEELVLIYDASSMNETTCYLYIYDILKNEVVQPFIQQQGAGICLTVEQEEYLRHSLENDEYFKNIISDKPYSFCYVRPMIANLGTLCTEVRVVNEYMDTVVNMLVFYEYDKVTKSFIINDFIYTVY